MKDHYTLYVKVMVTNVFGVVIPVVNAVEDAKDHIQWQILQVEVSDFAKEWRIGRFDRPSVNSLEKKGYEKLNIR